MNISSHRLSIKFILITFATFFACSGNEDNIQPFTCGTSSVRLEATGTVVSTSDGYYIMPSDPIKNIDSEDLILLEAIEEKNTSDKGTQKIIDLSGLTDCDLSITGLINPTMPYKFTKLTVGSESIRTVIYRVEQAKVRKL